MAAIEGALSFSVASVVEDVLHQHENRSRDLDFDARRAEEAAIRRYEAAAWLRKVVGVVGARDLPAEPSEEEFRLGLRSGIILCSVLNKIQHGAVLKVVESPCNAAVIADGAALSAYQYFENGGKSSRVVNCVLALKSYYEWKQSGGNGVWKFGGNVKPTNSGKQFVRKNSEPFMSFWSRSMSANDKSLNACAEKDFNTAQPSSSLSKLVRAILLDKKPEKVPNLVESVLSKVIEDFEHHVSSQIGLKKENSGDLNIPLSNTSMIKPPAINVKKKEKMPNEDPEKNRIPDKESGRSFVKQQVIVNQMQKDIKALKHTLSTTKACMQFMQTKFNEEIHNLGLHVHGLAYAASGYHSVQEENRKLYNQVQDLKGSIRVYCRIRPFLPGQSNYSSTVDRIDEGVITINTSAKNGKVRISFNFNKVFGPSATQDEVFSDTQPLVRSVLDGYNVCIFAYGQTGSGKTYTMSGPKDLTEKNQGVNYRALSDLFLIAEQRKDTFFYDVSVQMIEIYNEQVRDLLATDGLSKRLEIRNSSQTGLNVPDASVVPVFSTSDIVDLMKIGQRNRAVGATALNDRSSRSHSCLTIHVQGRDLTSGAILRGCMHLVDLAGSERVDKSKVTGDRLKEAQHINRSLSALGDVISSLAQKNLHVPYRNSKLTQLLQDSLGGQAKTLMFVHISPEPDAVGETISTLKFAERVATVELGVARINKDSAEVKELREQVANLKADLAKKDREPVSMQQKVSSTGSPYSFQSSPCNSTIDARNVRLASPNGMRKPMEEVGNIEVQGNNTMRKKKQSLDLDNLLENSPSWPPLNNQHENTVDDDRESGSGEWVDKLMVNKQDRIGDENPVICWNPSNDNILYPENNQCGVTSDDLDAGTSDLSDPDLLWQFNHSKHGSFSNGIGQILKKPHAKQTKSPKLRTMIPKLGPSPSRKVVAAVPPQKIGGRQSTKTKRSVGSTK